MVLTLAHMYLILLADQLMSRISKFDLASFFVLESDNSSVFEFANFSAFEFPSFSAFETSSFSVLKRTTTFGLYA
jgi:hypothetical protein